MKYKTDLVLFSCLLIVSTLCIYIAWENHDLRNDNFLYKTAVNDYSQRDATIKLLDPELIDTVRNQYIVGIAYKTDEMYCVWTKDRTDEEINATLYHEMCHILTYRDYDHFCNWGD